MVQKDGASRHGTCDARRSLREWHSLVKAEGAYFAATERFANGQAFDWAAFAQDEGFADRRTRAARPAA
ncbi:hypothetical protein AB4Y40_08020 [Paraburkholderia sp. EG287B]|uniref:hypothetical protein n=1 Tax=Paraburkholderia sp. EG287B TaxID=3237010 RepID=UPI0034D2E74F